MIGGDSELGFVQKTVMPIRKAALWFSGYGLRQLGSLRMPGMGKWAYVPTWQACKCYAVLCCNISALALIFIFFGYCFGMIDCTQGWLRLLAWFRTSQCVRYGLMVLQPSVCFSCKLLRS